MHDGNEKFSTYYWGLHFIFLLYSCRIDFSLWNMIALLAHLCFIVPSSLTTYSIANFPEKPNSRFFCQYEVRIRKKPVMKYALLAYPHHLYEHCVWIKVHFAVAYCCIVNNCKRCQFCYIIWCFPNRTSNHNFSMVVIRKYFDELWSTKSQMIMYVIFLDYHGKAMEAT